MKEVAELKHVERTIDGTVRKFRKMTVRERADIEEKLVNQKRDKILANLKSSGVTGTDAYGELASFDDDPKATSLFFQMFNTTKGQRDIIKAAAEKEHPNEGDAILDAMPASQQAMIELAADICSVNLKPIAARDEEGEANGKEDPTTTLTSYKN